MGGGSGNTTTTTTSTPWTDAQDFARQAISYGEGMPGYWASQYPNYSSPGGVSYQGSRLASLDYDQESAMNAIRNLSQTPTNEFNYGRNWMQNTLQGNRSNTTAEGITTAWNKMINPTVSGLYTDALAPKLTAAYNAAYEPTISGSYTDPYKSYADSMYSQVMSPTATGRYVAPAEARVNQAFGMIDPTLTGSYLNPANNSYLGQYVQSAIDPITQAYQNNVIPGIRSTANAAGMRGSDAEALYLEQAANDYMKQIGNTTASMYAPAYEAERGRQMQAAQYPIDIFNEERNRQMSAAQYPTNQFNIERQLQMQAAQYPTDSWNQERQLQMQAAQYPTGLYQFERGLEQQTLPAATDYWNQLFTAQGNRAAIGEEQQKFDQATLDAAQEKFDANKWDMYNMIAALGNMAYTGGQVGGVTTSSQPNYSPGLASTLLGTGSGLAGLYGAYQMLSNA